MHMEDYWNSSFCRSTPMTSEERQKIEGVLQGLSAQDTSADKSDVTDGSIEPQDSERK